MTDIAATATRDARGRFQPGMSGNPAGKKPGTLNHATRWKMTLQEGEFETAARHIVQRACDGEFGPGRFVVERFDPRPRGRPVALDFAPDATVVERFVALSQAVATGAVTPDEARAVATMLDLESRARDRATPAEDPASRAALEADALAALDESLAALTARLPARPEPAEGPPACAAPERDTPASDAAPLAPSASEAPQAGRRVPVADLHSPCILLADAPRARDALWDARTRRADPGAGPPATGRGPLP